MGDDKAGAVLHDGLHAPLDQVLGEGIYRTGSFVHDKDLWLCQDGAR